MKYLENINNPDDLKNLDNNQLKELCEEIREVIIETVSKNGGHLASNLGIVEVTVALLKTFPELNNRIVWDVGHQCYAYKILTGRYKQIHTIRKEGGLSGFPKRSESKYDAFNVGHSSTSISAAFGIARSKFIKSESGHVIAIVGDGALTGGLVYEALNNAGRTKKNFIVILNDNKMSISRNVGSISRHLTRMRIKPSYARTKIGVEKTLDKIPLIGKASSRSISKFKMATKRFIYRSTLVENMGFQYYGPVSGHNITHLENVLDVAKTVNGPVVIHVITTKGKGYQHAENDPKNFHGVSSFDIESGESILKSNSYSDVFGKELCNLAKFNNKICAITAAMQSGTGLNDFSKLYRERFFDVGIAEGHAVVFAAGLAVGEMIPVFAVYSSFLQRSIDQVIHDVACQKLHIVIAVDRAGIVGEDGETHQGVFDVSLLNPISNVTIYSPCYFDELARDLNKAIYNDENLVVVRYPRGIQPYRPEDFIPSRKTYDLYSKKESKIAIFTYGRLFGFACEAQNDLEESNINIDVIKINTIKPLSKEVVQLALNYEHIFFFEEGVINGGVGQSFLYEIFSAGFKGKYKLTAIENTFVTHASVLSCLSKLNLDRQSMVRIIKDEFKI